MLRQTWFGADPRNLLMFYRGIMRSSFEYGSHIFRPTNQSNFGKINKMQYAAIRLSLGYRQSTPINIMLAEACEAPFKMRFAKLSNRFVARTFSLSDHTLIEKLYTLHSTLLKTNLNTHQIKTDFPTYRSFSLIQHLLPKIKSAPLPTPYEYPFELINAKPTIIMEIGTSLGQSKSPEQDLQKALAKFELNNHTQIYTDGSKFDSATYVGYAVHVPTHEASVQHRISSHASIYTAEALAISVALNLAEELNINKTIILSDSQSVLATLKHFSSSKKSSYIIYDILNKWHSMKEQGKEVIFAWIPSHVNIAGNEEADRLAKEAIHSGTDQTTTLPYTDFYEVFNRQLKNNTDKTLRTRGEKKGKQYFEKFYKGWRPPWFQNLKLDRPQITTICRMRSNHYNLNSSLFRKNIIESPLCECGQPEDLAHIF